jgi:hypothetical protein
VKAKLKKLRVIFLSCLLRGTSKGEKVAFSRAPPPFAPPAPLRGGSIFCFFLLPLVLIFINILFLPLPLPPLASSLLAKGAFFVFFKLKKQKMLPLREAQEGEA